MRGHAMRRWLRSGLVVLGVLVLLPVAAEAQSAKTKGRGQSKSSSTKTEARKDEAPKDEKPPTRNFLGDPKNFTRFGGWGSMGGAIGQFGFARSMLIMMPPVQEELKLTPEQKTALYTWMDESRNRGEAWGRKMREQQGGENGRGPGDAGDPFGNNNMPLMARIGQFTSLMAQVTNLAKESENDLAKILTAPQRKRLNEISLQMEGISALSRPEVAEPLNLAEDQVEFVQQTLTQARLMQMMTWIETGRAMSNLRGGRRPGRNGPGAPGQPPVPGADPQANPMPEPAQPPAAEENPADPNDPGARKAPDPRREEMRKQAEQQFTAMRERTDRIQEQSVREILRILTKGQKAKFDRMLGAPFDPNKISNLGPPSGSRGGAPGSNGPAAGQEPRGTRGGTP